MMNDYPVSISNYVITKVCYDYRIPLGTPQNTRISLQSAGPLKKGGSIELETHTNTDRMDINIAGLAIEHAAMAQAGGKPHDFESLLVMSGLLSDAIFRGLANRGHILGHYAPEEGSKQVTRYLNDLARSIYGDRSLITAYMEPSKVTEVHA